MDHLPIVYRVRWRVGGRPIEIRPELKETEPCHADMLRYDVAFHHPTDPSLVIFPVFKHRDGRFPLRITHARWDSFMLNLSRADVEVEGPVGDWIGYMHAVPSYALQKVTLNDYLKRQSDERGKTTIAGYR